jgi:hypothetical protein
LKRRQNAEGRRQECDHQIPEKRKRGDRSNESQGKRIELENGGAGSTLRQLKLRNDDAEEEDSSILI